MSDNEESQTIAAQESVSESQRKELEIEGFSDAVSLVQTLKNLDFPANKNVIVAFVEQKDIANEPIPRLKKMQDKQYSNVSQVAKAIHLV